MMMAIHSKAFVASIARHRFEIDGKGVRTLVLFAGCPLRCKYCINPTTWDLSPKCTEYTPEQLLEKVSVDSVYFQATNGGITFGGGEPLLNADFISDFVDIAPKSWSFAIETSLSVPFENLALLADKIEKFVVDIKSMDEQIYRSYTGGNLALATTNLQKLLDRIGSERIVVRVPIIPEYSDELSQSASAQLLLSMGVTNIDLFKYKVKT